MYSCYFFGHSSSSNPSKSKSSVSEMNNWTDDVMMQIDVISTFYFLPSTKRIFMSLTTLIKQSVASFLQKCGTVRFLNFSVCGSLLVYFRWFMWQTPHVQVLSILKRSRLLADRAWAEHKQYSVYGGHPVAHVTKIQVRNGITQGSYLGFCTLSLLLTACKLY